MARIIEEVAVKIGANTSGLEKGMKKARGEVDRTVAVFKTMAKVIGGVFTARAVFRWFSRTIRDTDSLIKTAKGVGFATGEYQKLTFVLDQVGVNAESARIALGDFQKRLAKPQFHKFFRQAGLDPKQLQGMSPAAAFDAAFNHLATKVNDPRAAGFFGTIFEEQAGKDMLKAARQMDAVLRARKDYDRYVGGGIARRGEKDIVELTNATKRLDLQWKVFSQTVAASAAPALTDAADIMSDMASFILPNVAREFDGLMSTLTDFGDALKLVFRDISKDAGILGKTALPSGTPLAAQRGDVALVNDIPDLSPSGVFTKTISGKAIARGRQWNAQAKEPYSIVNNIYVSDKSAAKAVEKGMKRAKAAEQRAP